MFIVLTRHDGQPLVVNVHKIDAMIPYTGFTTVYVGMNVFDVLESVVRITESVKENE